MCGRWGRRFRWCYLAPSAGQCADRQKDDKSPHYLTKLGCIPRSKRGNYLIGIAQSVYGVVGENTLVRQERFGHVGSMRI